MTKSKLKRSKNKRKSGQWLLVLDRINVFILVVVIVGMTLTFSLFYFIISKYSFENGLIIVNVTQTHRPLSLGNALYFSVITETTLGYGDITPIGYSKIAACFQVILGLIFAGVVVAKITSAISRQRRHDAMMTEGYWIEPCEGEDTFLITFSQIYLDGDTLRYNGTNFDESGADVGFYRSKLFDSDGTLLRFNYTNAPSSKKHFEEGIINVNFIKEPGEKVYTKHISNNIDVGKVEKSEFIGFRANERQIEIMTGDNVELRRQLVSNYKEIFYEHDLKKTKGRDYKRNKLDNDVTSWTKQ